MDFAAILAGLMAQYPVIGFVLLVLGSLVVLGQVYIAATPSKDDDAWFAALEAKPFIGPVLKFLASFAPIQRK